MDLNTISSVVRPHSRADLPPYVAGDAFIAGGTWLHSEPQAHLSRLVDLSTLGWQPLTVTQDGLEIAATCTLASLLSAQLPAAWTAAPLINQCCRALMASFKVWNMATVGGNLCMSLPAGAMISLTAALDGTCLIWTPDGGERRLSVFDFILGAGKNALAPGEVLRAIHLPADELTRRAVFRRASITQLGRSAALLVGTQRPGETGFSLTLSAATPRPLRLECPVPPTPEELRARIEAAVPPDGYFDDVYGAPAWRRHMTLHLAEQVRQELAGETTP